MTPLSFVLTLLKADDSEKGNKKELPPRPSASVFKT
jgi:hypothetical protein